MKRKKSALTKAVGCLFA